MRKIDGNKVSLILDMLVLIALKLLILLAFEITIATPRDYYSYKLNTNNAKDAKYMVALCNYHIRSKPAQSLALLPSKSKIVTLSL